MSGAPAKPIALEHSWRRLVLPLMAVASVGYVCRVAVTVAAPGMMSEFGLSQAQMGTVFTAFLTGYTFFQVPSGWLADRADMKRVFQTLCAGWFLLTALTAALGWREVGFTVALPLLWFIRGLLGVITAPTYPTSGRTIAVTVEPKLQARANSLVLASVGIGSAVTTILFAPISAQYGWRKSLMLVAVLAACAGVFWSLLAPRVGFGQQVSTAQEQEESASDGQERPSLERPLRNKSFWFLSASYFLQGYLGYIFVFWFYLYLVQVRHIAVAKAAWLGALPWMATIFAIAAGGVLSDAAVARWGTTRGRRSVPVVALCGAAVFLAVGARTASASVAVLTLTACTVLVLCTEGPFWATMTQLSGRRSGVAGGTMNFGSNLGGMISPTLTPWLAEKMGWESALVLTAGLAVVAGLLWLGVKVQPEKG